MKKQALTDLQEELETQKENSKDPLFLNKMVEDETINNDYSKREKPAHVFSPSQVGYCKRQMYNQKMNLTNMDRYVKGILHAGTVNHFWLEHNLPSMVSDRGLGTERKFRKRIEIDEKDFDLFVSGYADAVDTEGYVYDHKFTGDPSYAPKNKDIRQVMMYLYCLPDVHTGQLEYVRRDGKFGKKGNKPYIKVHEVEFDPEEFASVLRNMAEVAEAVKEREDTDKELINPFDRCEKDGGDPCFYCEDDHRDMKKEVVERAEEAGEWDRIVEG